MRAVTLYAAFAVPPAPMRGRQRDPVIGLTEGDRCQRQNGDGTVCPGTIDLIRDRTFQGCSCHICAPCSYCTSTMPECPVCGWREDD